jgi:hypothetical protein
LSKPDQQEWDDLNCNDHVNGNDNGGSAIVKSNHPYFDQAKAYYSSSGEGSAHTNDVVFVTNDERITRDGGLPK